MLSAATKKKFRTIGHSLKPVVIIGSKGLSANVIDEVKVSLDAHELIKIKIAAGERSERRPVIDEICQACSAELVQSIGKIALIFKPSKKAIYPIH